MCSISSLIANIFGGFFCNWSYSEKYAGLVFVNLFFNGMVIQLPVGELTSCDYLVTFSRSL